MEVSAYDLARQARWETEASRRAQKRYEEATAQARKYGDVASLAPGQALLRRVVPPLIKLVKAAQAEAQEALGIANGKPSSWCWPMLLLPADRIAFIAVAVALRCETRAQTPMGTVPMLADAFMRHVREEAEYQDWLGQQAEANKLAKASGDEEHHDLLAALRRTYPNLDRKAWARWSKKVKALRSETWDKVTVSIPFAGKLIELLVQAAPDMCAVVTKNIDRGRTQVTLELTETARKMMDDVDQRAAVSRPLRLPMLCPPRKWVYL